VASDTESGVPSGLSRLFSLSAVCIAARSVDCRLRRNPAAVVWGAVWTSTSGSMNSGKNLVVCGRDCLAVAQAAVAVDNSQLGLDTDFAIFHAITQAPC
jgi:hypothetical protein